MKATIEAISPAGFVIRFEVEAEHGIEAVVKRLIDIEIFLEEAGYAPTGQSPLTPDGLPICRKHGVPMKRREKQGDEWFSHMVEMDGEELYCKGRPGKDSPGWDIEAI